MRLVDVDKLKDGVSGGLILNYPNVLNFLDSQPSVIEIQEVKSERKNPEFGHENEFNVGDVVVWNQYISTSLTCKGVVLNKKDNVLTVFTSDMKLMTGSDQYWIRTGRVIMLSSILDNVLKEDEFYLTSVTDTPLTDEIAAMQNQIKQLTHRVNKLEQLNRDGWNSK